VSTVSRMTVIAVFKATVGAICISFMLATNAAFGATFNVNSSSCAGGAGTLSDALRAANSSAGHDIIDCDMGQSVFDPQLIVTDSVTINGNGLKSSNI